MAHTHESDDHPVQLSELARELIAELPDQSAGRAARTVVGGSAMRVTLLALAAGSELAEHDSPGAATLQVIEGSIRLKAGEREWPLQAGELVRIPPQRHSVEADEDSAFMLTVALHG